MAYDDEKTALEFLTKAFGLHEQTRMQGPDDASWHGWSSGAAH